MEENNKIHQPHDKYTKSVISRVDVAKSLIQSHLSPDLVKRIDIDSLQLTNKSFISEELQQIHSDVVYKCNIDNQQGYLYFEIEHQSTPDEQLPLRILDYNIQLMKQHLNEGHKKLPIIINEIIYAGTTSPYPYSVDIINMFENPVLAKEIMFKPPIMTDLTTRSDKELVEEGLAGLMQVMIKQGVVRDHLNWIKENKQLFCSIANSPLGYTSVVYILTTDAVNDPEKLKQAIVEAAPNQEETVMTAAAQIEEVGIKKGMELGLLTGIEKGIEKGMAQGMEKGIEKRTLDIAKNMLLKNSDINFISDITGLTINEIKSLHI